MQKYLTVWHRLKAIVLRRRLDRDLDEEVAFHLSMREADYRQSGLADQAARDAARRQFGNVTHFKEQTRDMWRFPSFDSLMQDVRYAFRTLRKSPGFTIVAVLALALGIGANTAIFSLVDAVRGRALPYQHTERLVELWGNVMRAKVERRGASYPDFADWRAQTKSFDDMAAFDSIGMTLIGGDEPARITVETVSAPYFRLLGVDALRGRAFRDDEDLPATPSLVVILSDGVWQRRFGGDPQIVGKPLTLNTRSYTVIGIMPAWFKGLTDSADLWVPITAVSSPDNLADRGSRGFQVLARLKAGVRAPAAQSELDTISTSHRCCRNCRRCRSRRRGVSRVLHPGRARDARRPAARPSL